MIRPWLVLSMALTMPWAVAGGSVAHAHELHADDPLLLALRAESAAFDQLVAVVKAEVRANNLDLSDEAKLSWQRGVLVWDDVERDLAKGAWQDAIVLARLARLSCQKGADEALSARASRELKQAVKGYLDAIGPRMAAVRERLGAAQDPVLLERWRSAKTRFESAKQLVAVEQLRSAWPTLVSAAGSLDELIVDVARTEGDRATTGTERRR